MSDKTSFLQKNTAYYQSKPQNQSQPLKLNKFATQNFSSNPYQNQQQPSPPKDLYKSFKTSSSGFDTSITTQDCKHTIQELMLLPSQENYQCFDCGGDHPSWVSVNNGLFLCLNCAGVHRGFGVQVSFMRSLLMDKLTSKQLQMLREGGNKRMFDFLSKYDLIYEVPKKRYSTKAAQYYRRKIQAAVDNKPFDLQEPSFEEGREQLYEQKTQAKQGEQLNVLERKRSFDNENRHSPLIQHNDQDLQPTYQSPPTEQLENDVKSEQMSSEKKLDLQLLAKKFNQALEEHKVQERASEIASKSLEFSKEVLQRASSGLQQLNENEKVRKIKRRTGESIDEFSTKLGSFKQSLWKYMTEACSGKACPQNERPSTMNKQEFVIVESEISNVFEIVDNRPIKQQHVQGNQE